MRWDLIRSISLVLNLFYSQADFEPGILLSQPPGYLGLQVCRAEEVTCDLEAGSDLV